MTVWSTCAASTAEAVGREECAQVVTECRGFPAQGGSDEFRSKRARQKARGCVRRRAPQPGLDRPRERRPIRGSGAHLGPVACTGNAGCRAPEVGIPGLQAGEVIQPLMCTRQAVGLVFCRREPYVARANRPAISSPASEEAACVGGAGGYSYWRKRREALALNVRLTVSDRRDALAQHNVRRRSTESLGTVV